MAKKPLQVLKGGRITLPCFFCGTNVSTTVDVGKLLCGNCTAKCADAPAPLKPYVDPTVAYRTKLARAEAKAAKKLEKLAVTAAKPAGRGRGWHLKRIFEFDGKFYSFGTEITKAEADKLLKTT